MIQLPEVTLSCVTSVEIEKSSRAIAESTRHIQFGKVQFISDQEPNHHVFNCDVEWIKIPTLDYVGYSEFMFHELYKYLETPYSLTVQHDGWIHNPGLWRDEFLEYDYIGAPWEHSEEAYMTRQGEHVRVGNGGVCLRSSFMLNAPTDLNMELKEEQGYYNEDGNFCVYHRKEFLDHGAGYAPIEVAAKFSTEKWIDGISTDSFAFHGQGVQYF